MTELTGNQSKPSCKPDTPPEAGDGLHGISQPDNAGIDGGRLLSTPDCNATINNISKGEAASGIKATDRHALTINTKSLYLSADAAALSPEDQAKRDYEKTFGEYKKTVDTYWSQVETAKKEGRTVSEFPPIYDGPPAPKGAEQTKSPSTIPSIDNMLDQAKGLSRLAAQDGSKPDFVPKTLSEQEFKDAYAREALHVGAALNLSKEETRNVVNGIYAFECSGKATYDMLSGVPLELTKPDAPGKTDNIEARRKLNPDSSGLGYNQIMMATNLGFIEEHSKEIADRLRENAKGLPWQDQVEAKATLYENLHNVLHKELDTMANKDDASKAKYLDKDGKFKYSLYSDFAKSKEINSTGLTGRQLSSGLHALNLDGDIGPVVQSMQLKDVLSHSLSDKMKQSLALKAAELKERAAAYDGLPAEKKADAINEVFTRAGTSPELSSLRQKIEKLPDGLSEDVTRKNLSETEWRTLNSKILSMKKAGENGNPVSQEGQALIDKLTYAHFGGPKSDDFLSAAVQLGNLAGTDQAERMLKPENSDLPTVNFFDRKGYEGNSPVVRRSADELLRTIHRIMHGPNAAPTNWGNTQFEKAFDQLK